MKIRNELERIYVSAPSVVVNEIAGEWVVMPIIAGSDDIRNVFLSFNETGRYFWKLLDGQRSLGQIIRCLQSEYDVSARVASEDVNGLLAEMLAMGIVVEKITADSNEPSRSGGVGFPHHVLIEIIRALREKGASFRFQAKGSSMGPAIRDGDVITVSPLKDIRPRRGDVLAFRHPGRPQILVHRVLNARERKFYFKGDNCPEADGWVPAENILGLISKVERRGKSVFWPDRGSACARFYFRLYVLWLPVRRILARGYRFFISNRLSRK